jgi:hypothetical protein
MLGQSPDYLKSFENNFSMWRVGKLLSKILASPMLIVLAKSPHSGLCYIVDNTLVGDPYLWLVLTIAKRQLGAGNGAEFLAIVIQNF